MSQILDRIVRTDHGAKRRTSQVIAWRVVLADIRDLWETRSEIVEIQRYIVSRPEASTSIDKGIKTPTDSNRRTSIDEATPTNRGHLVTKVTSDVSDVNNHGKEISDDTYATLVRQQCKLDCLGDRLHKIENTTATTNDKWRRGDEAMRDFTGIWFNKST
ncbi:hypothetical protein F2Q68_00015810 [Brassica cretica]|uniref:Uncharacterized protein n=1 Tax=Brassica cretica TaxID=69181 RepID=A0A8S9HGD6_BRACR|nr:hypothetical protein F2Q68_00015810 [Brassica cretica]